MIVKPSEIGAAPPLPMPRSGIKTVPVTVKTSNAQQTPHSQCLPSKVCYAIYSFKGAGC